MDVADLRRLAIGGTVSLMLLTIVVNIAQASAALVPGRRCSASESAIKDNLPLGQNTHETEIIRIETVFVPASHDLVGWLYSTRKGEDFIEIRSPAGIAHIIAQAGDSDLAVRFARARPGTYFELPRRAVRTIRSENLVVLSACAGTGL